MDLRQLRYFVAVAERGSFSAAASALNVAQSALSKHVKELEHELGGALFARSTRGVSVTESGKVLLSRGRWLLNTVEDIKAETQTENRDPGGIVRLAAPSSFAEIFYAPLVQLFAERFPRIQLELGEGLTEVVSDRLLRSELDIAVTTAPQRSDQFIYETLVVEQVFLVGAPGDPMLKRGKITRKQFNDLPMSVPPISRNPFPSHIPYTVRVESSQPMKQIIALGRGYGVLPFSAIHEELTSGSLSAVPLPWRRADRVLTLPRGRPVSRATSEVASALKQVCSQLIQEGKLRITQPRKISR